MKIKSKVETIEEYLARGGAITICPRGEIKPSKVEVSKKSGGPAIIMSLDDANLFYGEERPKKTKKKQTKAKQSLDMNALPEHLKNKFLSKLKEEYGKEED